MQHHSPPDEVLEQFGQVKGELVNYALSDDVARHFRRHYAELRPAMEAGTLTPEGAIDAFIFDHVFDDGSSLVDRFIARKKIGDSDLAYIRGMREGYTSVFTALEPAQKSKDSDFETVRVRCCQSDLEYRIVPTVAGILSSVQEGMFLIGRFCPIAGTEFWTPSGPTSLLPASARDGVAEMVQQDVLARPYLTHRNPQYRQRAMELATQMYERFISQHGSNLIFGAGANLARKYADAMVDSSISEAVEERLEKSSDMLFKSFMDSPLAAETGVALYIQPSAGPSFFERGEEFATALAAGAQLDSGAAELVRDYLQDDSISPQFIEHVILERLPASQEALAQVLEEPDFDWASDGEQFLDQLPGEHEPSNRLAILPLLCRPEE